MDILFVDILFADIRSAVTRSAATLFVGILFADIPSEGAALMAPPSSLAATIRGLHRSRGVRKTQSDAVGPVLGVSGGLFHAEYRFAPPRVLADAAPDVLRIRIGRRRGFPGVAGSEIASKVR